MKETVFIENHRKAGAKIVPFAGYMMPLEYTGLIDEHLNVRNNIGVFDVSHMGEIWVRGENAYRFLQRMISNDISKLFPGKAQYAYFPNEKGGIVDDLFVYKFGEQEYLLVVNASNTEKDWNWLVQNNNEKADLLNASDSISQLAVQGPNAVKVMQKLTTADLSSVKSFCFIKTEVAGVKDVIVSATGYTGAGGFELYFNNEDGQKIWEGLFEAGKEYCIKPSGLGCRDTLRTEMGYCLYGNDIDDDTCPFDAGLAWVTKITPEKNLIGKEILLARQKEGAKQRLTGIEMIERGIPRHGYIVTDAEGKQIGKVTSGTMSPSMKNGIGMAYIDIEFAEPGTKVFVEIRNKNIPAQVTKFPIYKI